MPLQPPNLDDRDFEQLVEEARRRITTSCPTWTDLSPSDPGIVLLELFAHLTETMIYRLNRLPEKAFIEFLRLIGVHTHPPAAASVTLRFSRSQASDRPIEIPRGTRATIKRAEGSGEPPVFTTARTVTIPAGEAQIDTLAHHCNLVEAELADTGAGLPGLSVKVRRPPVVAPTGDRFDLVVGVEVTPDELDEQAPVIQHDDKVYRVWREVDSFTNLGPERFVYTADRMTGTITFAPAARMEDESGKLEATPQALAAIPPAGKEIRLWYRRGGGPEGNVAAETLTVLKDSIPGVEVTNPTPATGGQAAETLDNALARGPQELHSLHRAVTARDFESVALHSSRSVARARALTRAALWAHATPGTVEVLLVPYLPEEERSAGQVTAEALREQQTQEVRSQIQRALDERRPLGTTCVVNWARYKTVRAKARIVVHRHADRATIRRRVIRRLHQTINPLPTQPDARGWPFGQALRTSHVYDIALAEPGVLWVDSVRLVVEEVPDKAVVSVASDAFQPRTWYAGSGATLFRSLNDGHGWEIAGRFPDRQIELVRTHPERPGLLAIAVQLPGGESSRIHISMDCGESWETTAYTTAFEVKDMTWIMREDVPALLLATDLGLYELQVGGSPVQVLVDPQDQDRGFYAVVASKDIRGQISVAAAAQATGGVYLSSEEGRSNTFRLTGLQGEDIRELAVQYDGPRSFLWAGAAAAGGEAGKGCFRWELRGAEDAPEGWRTFDEGWTGGSCRGLAFLGTQALAASHRAGVLRLDTSKREAKWQPSDVRGGLPLRDPGRFHPVDTIAADPAARLVISGGQEGVFRSEDGGISYESSSNKEFSEKMTLPPTWLFCSGEHEIVAVSEDEAERD